MARIDQLEIMRIEFKVSVGDAKCSPQTKRMLFCSSGLFDAIVSEMTDVELPEGHVVIVTDKKVGVEPDPSKNEPPLEIEEFVAQLALNGETVYAVSNPRASDWFRHFQMIKERSERLIRRLHRLSSKDTFKNVSLVV